MDLHPQLERTGARRLLGEEDVEQMEGFFSLPRSEAGARTLDDRVLVATVGNDRIAAALTTKVQAHIRACPDGLLPCGRIAKESNGIPRWISGAVVVSCASGLSGLPN